MDIKDDDDNLEHIRNKQPIFIDISLIEKIKTSNIIENICKLKIESQDGNIIFANGFFCYIPSKEMKVFITNNHVIDQNYLDNKSEIKFLIENNDNEKEEKTISLKTKRFITTNKDLDTTVIEILDEDNIKSFFEVDEIFFQNKDLKNEEIFSLFFQNGQKLKIFIGKILDSSGNFFKINARTDSIPSGSPLISVDGMKIIGLHKGFSNTLGDNQKYNLGVSLDKIIGIIPKSNYPFNTNVIKCIYYIDIRDSHKDIKVYDNSHNLEEKIKNVTIDGDEKNKGNIKNGIYKFNRKGKYLFCYHFDNS